MTVIKTLLNVWGQTVVGNEEIDLTLKTFIVLVEYWNSR